MYQFCRITVVCTQLVSSSKELKDSFAFLYHSSSLSLTLFHPQRNWKSSSWKTISSLSSNGHRFILKGIESIITGVPHYQVVMRVSSSKELKAALPHIWSNSIGVSFILKGIESSWSTTLIISKPLSFILKGIESPCQLSFRLGVGIFLFHPQRNWKLV